MVQRRKNAAPVHCNAKLILSNRLYGWIDMFYE